MLIKFKLIIDDIKLFKLFINENILITYKLYIYIGRILFARSKTTESHGKPRKATESHGKPRKGTEGHGRARKGTEGHGRPRRQYLRHGDNI